MSQYSGPAYRRHALITVPLFRRAKILNNFDLILTCTDKLLARWRASPHQHIHRDIVQQSQNLLLEIFGLISFDYDLDTISGRTSSQNELSKALQDFMNACELVFFTPSIVGNIYTKLSRRHQRSKATIARYIHRMIDNEMAATPESRAERKRTCLIASFVASLQEDEDAESKKSEDEKKGKTYFVSICRSLWFVLHKKVHL